MKVWAGCEACWDDHVYTGRWVDVEHLADVDPEELHQLEAFGVIVTGKHLRPAHGYTLEEFGIPLEQEPEAVTAQAEIMDALTEAGYEYSAWLMVAWMLDREVHEVTPAQFRALYVGQWVGKPTRALRKRYTLTRAGEEHYYMWRKA